MASNISVAITVDNKQYIANINAASSATQKFGQNASKSINDVNLVSNNLISRIGGLKSALAGLVSATAIQSANNFANAIKDISVTSDVSIEGVLGLSRAFELNGGTAEGAQAAILKFADTIAQARSGNDSAIKSFREIGISVDTLNKNGIEELLKKSITGISGLSSATAQIRNQTDLFGKSAKAVSFGGVQQTQQGQVIDPATVAALKSGADASENMKKQFSNLTDALLKVSKPLNDIVKSIDISVSAFESLIKAVVGAVATFALFKYVVAPMTAVALTLGEVSVAASTAGATVLRFFTPLINIFKDMWGFLRLIFAGLTDISLAGARFGIVLAGVVGFFGKFLGLAGIIYTVAQAVDFLSKLLLNGFSPLDYTINKFKELYAAAKKYFDLEPADKVGGGRGGNADTLKQQQERGEELRKQRETEIAAAKSLRERYAKIKNEIKDIGESFDKNNELQLRALEISRLELGYTDDQIEKTRALDEQTARFEKTMESLQKKRRDFAIGTEDQRANVGAVDAEIAALKKLEVIQGTALNKTIDKLQEERRTKANNLQITKNIVEYMEQMAQAQAEISGAADQQSQAKTSAFEQLDAQKQAFDILMRREELERSILNLREHDKTAAMQLFDLENERKRQLEDLRKIQNLPFEGVGGMKQRLEEINKLYDDRQAKIKETQQITTEEQNSFSFGWVQASEKFRNSITTAAEYGGQIFSTFSKGMEDVFVKFVQTGKLSFTDLINTMIAQFARMQAQKALQGIFGKDASGGDFLSSIGGFFSGLFKADGGPVQGNSPYIVGERGPELFVPQNAGRIIPNHALGMGQPMVNNNITEVSYNIQAVDASSFRSLVARDPEFIHNVAEQGRRSMPIRSRR